MMRALVSAAALAAALGTVVIAAPGCEAKVQTPTGPGSIAMHVHNLTVDADRTKLQQALEAVDGVEKVVIDDKGYVTVTVKDQAVTTGAKLIKVVGDSGFNGHLGGH